jgi:hypothetical protein
MDFLVADDGENAEMSLVVSVSAHTPLMAV